MIINIKEIKEGTSVLDETVTMTQEQITLGNIAGPVMCHASINRVRDQIFLRISYSCAVHETCARCCSSFDYDVNGDYDVILRHFNSRMEKEDDTINGDGTFYYKESDTMMDLRQSLYDEVMVNLPIVPLCKPDCDAVSEYAVNTKKEEAVHTVDPRWETLKKLKTK